MRQLQPVVWAKGVLLTPQHLQVQDRYLEDLITFRLDGLAFAPWGFHKFAVNREELAAGSFAISTATGVFPDGLPFDVPASDPAPAPRPLKESWRPDQRTLDVFLTIPQYQPGGGNIAGTETQGATRFHRASIKRRDENSGLAEKQISVARKNLRFLVSGEPLEGSSVLPVARIRRRETGDYELDPHFVPPLVSFSASDYLVAIMRRLVEILATKSTTVAGGRLQRKESLAEFAERDVAKFWLLYTINSHFPRIRHLFEQQHTHPVAVYQEMAALAGALTTFSDDVGSTKDLPAYDHSELGSCFTRLDVRLRELLETVVPDRCVSLTFRAVSEFVQATSLDDDRYLQAPQMYLGLKTATTGNDLARAAALLKVSAGTRLDSLIRSQLPGLQLRRVTQPPADIPYKLDYHYFELVRQGPEWDAITRGRQLSVYVPSDLAEPRLELLILLPEPQPAGRPATK